MLFGIMGFLLGFGDSFHLIPRIIAHLTTGLEDYQMALGIGKLITGITMTIFYYLIYRYYVLLTENDNKTIHTTIITLMIIRFVLLALPGNDWINNGNSLFYGILRNIPFAILGSLIIVLFLKIGKEKEYRSFKKMGVWIIVSFVCYTIVVVGSGFIPVLGAFMIPKTIAYFIIIYIGFKN
jgi:Ni,Fe-hydrogenase I cytochrome b subunit